MTSGSARLVQLEPSRPRDIQAVLDFLGTVKAKPASSRRSADGSIRSMSPSSGIDGMTVATYFVPPV